MQVFKDIVYFDQTMILTIINTLILFFVLKHFLYDRVKKVLNDRELEVSAIYDTANAANETAQLLKAQYESQISTSRQQADEIIISANRRAQAQTEEMLAIAKEKAFGEQQKAQAQIAADKKRALNEIKNDVAALAIDAAGQIVKKELDISEHEKLIADFIENAGEIEWQN